MRNFEFPPYPEDWIILEENLTNETYEDPEFPGLVDKYHYKQVKVLFLGENSVGVNWATCWLSPDMVGEGGPVWELDPESGGNFTFEELRRILAILGPNF